MDPINNPILLLLVFLLLGLIIGFLMGYWWMRLKQGADLLDKKKVEEAYVPKALYSVLQQQMDVLQDNFQEKVRQEKEQVAELATVRARLIHTEDRLDKQVDELRKQEKQARLAFENVANRLLEEKSQKFADQNKEQLKDLLDPLREKIKVFEDSIERKYIEETKDRVSLKKEIEQLRELNQQLSLDAGNLAAALKGDNKTQGDWGELQLERLLEKAGLQKNTHFRTQGSYRDNENQLKRPDFIIELPDDKQLVIDCKVSLTAYERYCSAETNEQRKKALKKHLDSIRAHIKGLSGKKYQELYEINSPDYVLLFVPIEPAFSLAVQEDQQLFLDALEQNIVLVTNSTLLATMRTVSFIWKQEKQKRSVLEISRQSGLLYDKFVNFVEDLRNVGQRLDHAQQAYDSAMHKLTEGKRYGNTLIGRAEKLRKLGARTTKKLPKELIDIQEEE